MSPNLGRTHTLIRPDVNHISLDGNTLYYPTDNTDMVIDKIERYSYDSRNPFVNMSIIFKINVLANANAIKYFSLQVFFYLFIWNGYLSGDKNCFSLVFTFTL